MNFNPKELAIIGATASGKSALAIEVAKKMNAYILSIDSLSIYKEIDIVSAKSSTEELSEVKHFGIDEIYPDEYFSVDIFIDLYKKIKDRSIKDEKNLIIVGGTSFYLKSLMQGLSRLPKIEDSVVYEVKDELKQLKKCHDKLTKIDRKYMQNISMNDSYRIEKAMLIHVASGLTPTEWFKSNPAEPIIQNLKSYNIDVQRDILRERIDRRTAMMIDMGAIDEVCYLEYKYSREPNSMGAIGIVEVLEYLDGKVSKDKMIENISTHTSQLAKRQQTFNKSQFSDIKNAKVDELQDIILRDFGV